MSSEKKGKNDTAWEALFEKYDILNNIKDKGSFYISADQIREYREPRLMAKFDHEINLPRIFAKNKLAILPVSRGDYVISHFRAYEKFENPRRHIEKARLPEFIESVNTKHITSESVAVNCALASGILNDFLEEDVLFPTVSGRMGSAEFYFKVKDNVSNSLLEIGVANSQIEIDAAYEGKNSLSLLEAKLDLSEDFLVRQLYYPYRVWAGRVKKKVRPVFLVYSNGIFYLFEYEFKDPYVYNSLRLVKQKNYSVEDMKITLEDLKDVLHRSVQREEPKVPFPQADNFDRVINLCELLYNRPLERDEVTQEYAFDVRQTNYYTDAGRYLGLIEKKTHARKPVYYLSQQGRYVMEQPYRGRQLELCGRILEHKVFRDILKIYLETGIMPERKNVIECMKSSGLYHVDGESTFYRRASTVNSWVSWMTKLIRNSI